ncbi:shikimate dehydrogenase [Deinococcus sp. Arct2-2]|uniref:shikimate dehydrogenase n=1 Tax=Deinococcus sp. Arct2-2 TaxID=2568653 RepID=UPI0023EF4D17|nr:shikimate dehydrogenase [Deinococcus sp. Arct2-2]
MSFTGVYPDGAQAALRAFLYADPAAHSLSPAMHRAAFAWAGLAGEYQAVRVPPADLGAAIAELRQPGILGANLSLPHKEAALPYLDSLTDAARAIGAVNTIISEEGKLLGDNTDAPGLFSALSDLGAGSTGSNESDLPVVVLGAGGAARAAVYTALILMERDVYIYNRTHQKAIQLAANWTVPDADFQVLAGHLENIPWTRVGLIVNASSAGLNAPHESPLPDFDFSPLLKSALIYDMVYKPAETRLMRDARAAGLRAENGLGMLAHQARLAFLAWTGVDVPVRVFLDALHAAQAPASPDRASHV